MSLPAEQLDALIHKYNVSGPRYTSYPTALQFESFDEVGLREAIIRSDSASKDLSLYFHLPFCDTLCYYCACNKIVTRKRAPLEQYLIDLDQEMEMLAPLFQNRKVSQLHWGGGTPTFLDNEQIKNLMLSIGQKFELANDDDGEFSIEIDPRTVDAERIKSLRESGFNRLSFGVQDFDVKVQKAVNRIQSFTQTMDVIQAARKNDFRSISIDLIYGLPHQSVSSIAETLSKVIKLSPDRISIYNYAHLPERFYPQKRILATDLPSPDEKLDILKLCIDTLTDAGYVYIGMDHFAKPDDELAIAQKEGSLQRNFQGYSTRAECDLMAFGVTSISQIGNVFSQNFKTIEAYSEAISNKLLPVEKGVVIDQDDLIRQRVIKALICQFELNFSEIETQFDIDFLDYFSDELKQLAEMQSDGLLQVDLVPAEKQIHVTDAGRLFIRNICMVFDRYLNRGKPDATGKTTRFSKAI